MVLCCRRYTYFVVAHIYNLFAARRIILFIRLPTPLGFAFLYILHFVRRLAELLEGGTPQKRAGSSEERGKLERKTYSDDAIHQKIKNRVLLFSFSSLV